MILRTLQDFKDAALLHNEIKTETIFYTEELKENYNEYPQLIIGDYYKDYGVFAGFLDNHQIWVGKRNSPCKMTWKAGKEWCDDYKNNPEDFEGQYHMPTQRELMLIFINKDKINKALKDNNCEPLKDEWYWSSSEHDSSWAWLQRFSDGLVSYGSNKNYSLYVRPVLAF